MKTLQESIMDDDQELDKRLSQGTDGFNKYLELVQKAAKYGSRIVTDKDYIPITSKDRQLFKAMLETIGLENDVDESKLYAHMDKYSSSYGPKRVMTYSVGIGLGTDSPYYPIRAELNPKTHMIILYIANDPDTYCYTKLKWNNEILEHFLYTQGFCRVPKLFGHTTNTQYSKII